MHHVCEETVRRLLPFLFLLPFAFLSAQETVQRADAKDFDGARKMLETSVHRNDGDSEAHFQLGILLFDHFRDLDAAEEQLERAVEIAESRADYHFVLGRVYGAIAQNGGVFSGMKYAGKVKAEFIRAVELDPNNLTYHSALLSYYLMAPSIVGGSVSKAREQAEALLRLDAHEGHMAFAQVAEYEKDYQAAETRYKAAIAANPAKPRAYHRLGYLYLNQQRLDEAIAQFREYVRYAPDDPNSHDSLGEALLEKGAYDEALQEYAKALAMNPRFFDSLYGTARCYEGKGMRTEALSFYRQFLSFNPSGETAETAQRQVEELQK